MASDQNRSLHSLQPKVLKLFASLSKNLDAHFQEAGGSATKALTCQILGKACQISQKQNLSKLRRTWSGVVHVGSGNKFGDVRGFFKKRCRSAAAFLKQVDAMSDFGISRPRRSIQWIIPQCVTCEVASKCQIAFPIATSSLQQFSLLLQSFTNVLSFAHASVQDGKKLETVLTCKKKRSCNLFQT